MPESTPSDAKPGADRVIIPPVPVLARPPVRLFLVSSTILFAELLIIRWVPANVIYVGFFRNFLLMASFLGIGLGILWGRNANRIRVPMFGPLLLILTLLVLTARPSSAQSSSGRCFEKKQIGERAVEESTACTAAASASCRNTRPATAACAAERMRCLRVSMCASPGSRVRTVAV